MRKVIGPFAATEGTLLRRPSAEDRLLQGLGGRTPRAAPGSRRGVGGPAGPEVGAIEGGRFGAAVRAIVPVPL